MASFFRSETRSYTPLLSDFATFKGPCPSFGHNSMYKPSIQIFKTSEVSRSRSVSGWDSERGEHAGGAALLPRIEGKLLGPCGTQFVGIWGCSRHHKTSSRPNGPLGP